MDEEEYEGYDEEEEYQGYNEFADDDDYQDSDEDSEGAKSNRVSTDGSDEDAEEELAPNDGSDIKTAVMRPFVATLSPQFNNTLDYSRIKEARISVMAFYGGELFDVSHMQKTYENPYLARLVNDCNNAGMPFMLYVTTRARNLKEADEECKALYYVISQFPPELGLWIRIETNNNVEINNEIIELYYKYAEKWGLKSRLGLYLDYSRLNCITWTQFQDRFYLWLIDPTDVSTIDDELLRPELFEVP